ncbi:MAG: hypothetical protein ABIT04_12880 [Novosphingobium sp.]
MKRRMYYTLSASALLIALAGCDHQQKGTASGDGLSDSHFQQADEDYFHDMDNGVALTPSEVKGRNMWLVWTGDNDWFWHHMSEPTFGGFDLLKLVAAPPGSPNARANRWKQLGFVNEPCFEAAAKPGKWGLYLDQRTPGCVPDPFANATKYPGVKSGALGRVQAAGSYFGEPTGILGLRLFPNPDFDEAAAKHWKATDYYNNRGYFEDKRLIRPFRVGMSCGFCHVGPSPIHPPKDPNNPAFADLNSTVGAQYMWADRLFMWEARPSNFMYQLVKTFRPGALDTSLVSTDNINNPRTMNAIYNLGARLDVGKALARERLAAGSIDNKQFNDFVKDGPLTKFYDKPFALAPHVLKDGSDSVGALGALNRVYLNIGLFGREWVKHFNPVVGGKPIDAITIAQARRDSAYWRATEAGTPDIARFFLKAARPDRLMDAPGGTSYLAADGLVAQGRIVFANTCARCHSSKQPASPNGASAPAEIGADYMQRFRSWWHWTQSPRFKQGMRAIVADPRFLDGNYLSSDARIPQTLLRTNLCSPLATNALRGNIWDNFSSESYKNLPSIGTTSYQNPFTGAWQAYPMPAGGRGYTRVPSLISLWSTAPYLLNNRVGPFNGDPSVAGRMAMFDASIRQMLWPETRERDTETPNAEGVIDRTDAQSFVYVPRSWIPRVPGMGAAEERLLRSLRTDANGTIELGPIPKGMPVNLLGSFQILAESRDPKVVLQHYQAILKFLVAFNRLLPNRPDGSSDAALRTHFAPLREPLMTLSKCPDFVVNRGHYFGTARFNDRPGMTEDERAFGTETPLTDEQKRALIAFLKTL